MRGGVVVVIVKGVEFGANCILALEDVSPDPPWKHLGKLVFGVCTGGHRKDVVQLLQRALFGLREEEEDHDKGEEVKPRIEAKCALRLESPKHIRERERQDGCPKVVGRDGPSHSDFTVRERKYLCRVGERDWALTGRIERVEEVDEEGYQPEMCFAALRYPETEAGCKKGPAHLWEGEYQQAASSEGIDRPDSWPSEEEVDKPKTKCRQKRFNVAGTGLGKDGGGIECHDINCVKKKKKRLALPFSPADRDCDLLPHIC